jgi:hypothetical protein
MTDVRRPTREQMAAEYRARQGAAREAKVKEARRTDAFRQGGMSETIFGRFVGPGEVPSHQAPPAPRWPWEDER